MSTEVSPQRTAVFRHSGHLDTLTPPAIDTAEKHNEGDLFAIPEFLRRAELPKEPSQDEDIY